jgi:MoxR-like ATPase
MRIRLGYPDRAAERDLLEMGGTRRKLVDLPPCLTPQQVIDIQKAVTRVHQSEALLEYLQDILAFTRRSSAFAVGLSPRAGLALLRATRARAFLHDRDYALPEDLQRVLPWVVGHRLRSAESLGEIPPPQLESLLKQVPIP